MKDAPNDLEEKKNKLTKTKERGSKKNSKHVSYDVTVILKDGALYAQTKIAVGDAL